MSVNLSITSDRRVQKQSTKKKNEFRVYLLDYGWDLYHGVNKIITIIKEPFYPNLRISQKVQT